MLGGALFDGSHVLCGIIGNTLVCEANVFPVAMIDG